MLVSFLASRRGRALGLLGVGLAFWPRAALASAGGTDAISPVVYSLAIIMLIALVGRDIATRLGQPAVLGELIAGVVLGNLDLFGFRRLDFIGANPAVDILAQLGVLVLLFEVGLESTVGQMLKVGWTSALVALLGVLAPFALGWGVAAWLLPGHSVYAHAFLGATLSATSVGITARVLKDLGQSKSAEARVILGAAVIDDVLGLIILAVVTGLIASAHHGEEMSYGSIAIIFTKAALFLAGALALGVFLAPRVFHFASMLRARGVLLGVGLAICFFLAWLAGVVGLAPIVGAFAAGLIAEDVHYKDFTRRGEQGLEEMISPISSFLAPIFFVVMGMRTDLRAFAGHGVLTLALALTIVAIVGKLLCSIGVLTRGVRRLVVGIGMIPRGEVGLIFANVGLTLRLGGEKIIDQEIYSALVAMVIVTTLATPPALKVAFAGRS